MEETKRMSERNDIDAPKYGVYKTELILLAKSNLTRFTRFIREYINRKEDVYKSNAMKFIDCLRTLSEC